MQNFLGLEIKMSENENENKNTHDPFSPQVWRWMIERGHNVFTPLPKYIPPPLVKPTLFKRIVSMIITIIAWIILIGLFIGFFFLRAY